MNGTMGSATTQLHLIGRCSDRPVSILFVKIMGIRYAKIIPWSD